MNTPEGNAIMEAAKLVQKEAYEAGRIKGHADATKRAAEIVADFKSRYWPINATVEAILENILAETGKGDLRKERESLLLQRLQGLCEAAEKVSRWAGRPEYAEDELEKLYEQIILCQPFLTTKPTDQTSKEI